MSPPDTRHVIIDAPNLSTPNHDVIKVRIDLKHNFDVRLTPVVPKRISRYGDIPEYVIAALYHNSGLKEDFLQEWRVGASRDSRIHAGAS